MEASPTEITSVESLKDETWPWIRPLIGPRRLQISVVGSSMDGLDRGRPRATAPASRDIGPPRCSPPQAVANADTHSPPVLLAWLSSGDLESVRAATLGVQGLVWRAERGACGEGLLTMCCLTFDAAPLLLPTLHSPLSRTYSSPPLPHLSCPVPSRLCKSKSRWHGLKRRSTSKSRGGHSRSSSVSKSLRLLLQQKPEVSCFLYPRAPRLMISLILAGQQLQRRRGMRSERLSGVPIDGRTHQVAVLQAWPPRRQQRMRRRQLGVALGHLMSSMSDASCSVYSTYPIDFSFCFFYVLMFMHISCSMK